MDTIARDAYDIWLEYSSTNSKQDERNHEWCHAVPCFQHGWNRATNHDNMGQSADQDTNPDGLIPSQFCIGYPAAENWNNISQKEENETKSDRELYTATESTCGLLRAYRRSTSTVATLRQWVLHEVRENGLHTIVRSSLCELDRAKHVGGDRDGVRNFPQCFGLFYL